MTDRLAEVGRWGDDTLPARVRKHAADNPDGLAFIAGDDRLTWRAFGEGSDQIAARLVASGLRERLRMA